MKYIVLAIGDELLAGQVVDTNSGAIARMLQPYGWESERVEVIADGALALEEALTRALEDVDVVLTTGGLGPTKDDETKQTLANLFGGRLVESPEVLANVRRVVEARGLRLNDLTAAQAMVPDCCRVIQNLVGTAPIMWFDRPGGKVVVSLPGVPFETLEMMQREVLPQLVERFPTRDALMRETVVVYNISESALAQILAPWEEKLPPYAHLAYLPKPGVLRLRLDGRHRNGEFLKEEMTRLHGELLSLIPRENFMADGDVTPEEELLRRLTDAGQTVTTAESCTGGTIASRLTTIAGASAAFRGGVVAYANGVKTAALGVSAEALAREGAVSCPVVEQMALGAKMLCGADFAVATSGIAGPGGGSDEKPVGSVWMAVATPDGRVMSKCYHFPGNRARVIDRAATTALLNLLATFDGLKTLI